MGTIVLIAINVGISSVTGNVKGSSQVKKEDTNNITHNSNLVGKLVLCFFITSSAYFLVMEHWAHIVPYLPYFILALCPLMHFFHHREHRVSDNQKGHDIDRREE